MSSMEKAQQLVAALNDRLDLGLDDLFDVAAMANRIAQEFDTGATVDIRDVIALFNRYSEIYRGEDDAGKAGLQADVEQLIENEPELFDPPDEGEWITVSMEELENYSYDNPFDASEGSFRFEFDASIDIQTAITNFSDDDTLFFKNTEYGEGDFNPSVDDYESDEAEVYVSYNEIHLMGLESNWFWDAESFKSIFGEDSLVFA